MRQRHGRTKLFFAVHLLMLLFGAAYTASAQSGSTQSSSQPTTIDAWRAGMAGGGQPAATTMTLNDNEEVITAVGENVVQKLTDLEFRWADALKQQNRARLSPLLASDFALTGERASSASVSKQSYVNRAVKEPLAANQKVDVPSVRVFGDTAIVNVRYTKAAPGNAAAPEFVITDVWVKRNNRWQAVTRHISEVVVAKP